MDLGNTLVKIGKLKKISLYGIKDQSPSHDGNGIYNSLVRDHYLI
jgi:hypothetical protein